jgi:uncharacterized protein YjbJ (UPF0337 family)
MLLERGSYLFVDAMETTVDMRCQERAMGVNKDQVRGRIKKVEGKVMEAAARLVGNRKLRVKGKVQGIVGAAQAKFGDAKQVVKDSLKRGV